MADTNGKTVRPKQATHFWLDANGSPGTDKAPVTIENATGYRYQSEAGWTYDYQLPHHKTGSVITGSVITMLALFGAKTQAINTASQARQAEEDQKAALVYRFETELVDGHWSDPREGGGVRYDQEALIEAVIAAFPGKATKEAVVAKIEAQTLPVYAKQALTNGKVVEAYNKIKGKDKATTDVLF